MTSGFGGLGGGRACSDFLRFLGLVALAFGGAEGFVMGAGAGGGGEWDVRDEGGEWDMISTDGERARWCS